MCFDINHNAKAPAERIAYKVVMKEGRRRHSWWARGRRAYTRYYPIGAVVRAHSGPRTSVFCGILQAQAGIYVFRDLEVAKRFADGGRRGVIIAVRVHPKDFLYSSVSWERYPAATYRKVRVLKVVK